MVMCSGRIQKFAPIMTKGIFNNIFFYNFMKVIIFDAKDCGDVKNIEPQVVEDRDAAEEAIAPLIDKVYDKVIEALQDMTVECTEDGFFVIRPDGTKYGLSLEGTLVLTPVERNVIKVEL